MCKHKITDLHRHNNHKIHTVMPHTHTHTQYFILWSTLRVCVQYVCVRMRESKREKERSSASSFISCHLFVLPKKTVLHKVTLSSEEKIFPLVSATENLQQNLLSIKLFVILYCMKDIKTHNFLSTVHKEKIKMAFEKYIFANTSNWQQM